MTMEEILTSGLAELGVPATAAQLSQLRAYYTLLDERSKVMNLTAITDPCEVARLHFLDSASLLPSKTLHERKVIDVGTGGGFPGLVLKILDPSIQLTLRQDRRGHRLRRGLSGTCRGDPRAGRGHHAHRQSPEARDVPAGGVRYGRSRERHMPCRTCRGRERAAREL